MGNSTQDASWRWEDVCGPAGLHPWNPIIRDMDYCFQRLFLLIPTLFLFAIISSYYIGTKINWVVRGKTQEGAIIIRSMCAAVLALSSIIKGYHYFFNENPIIAIDYFTCGTEIIAWLIHFVYLLALRHRLGISPRGPVVILVLWSITAVLSVTSLRTHILTDQPLSIAICTLVVQIIYAFTLLPSEGVTSSTYYSSALIGSQYSHLSEHHPLLQGLVEETDGIGTAMSNITCFSKLLFYWVEPLFEKGLKGKLKDPDDLFDLPIHLSCNIISAKMDKTLIGNVDMFQASTTNSLRTDNTHFRGNYGTINGSENSNAHAIPHVNVITPTRRHNISLLKALHSCFGIEFYFIGILKLLADISGFAGPLLLNKLVTFIEDPTVPSRMGYFYAGGLFLASLVSAFCDTHFNMKMSTIGIKIRIAITSIVFRKTLSISSTELNNKLSIGEVTNFMSTDTDRIVNSCPSFHAIWSLPFQLSVTLYLLYKQVGISFLAGVVFSVVLIPINRFVAKKIGSLSTHLMNHKDGRVSFTMELIKYIKTIKYYVWEDYYSEKIMDERLKEIKYLKGRKYLDALCVFFWATTPVVVTSLTLSTYVLLGNQLNAATVFTTIALLNMLIAPLNAFPWVLNGLIEAWVSVKRVQKLLDLDDLEDYDDSNVEDEIILSMKNACFAWIKSSNKSIQVLNCEEGSSEPHFSSRDQENTETAFILENLTFNLYRGQFVGIIGKVGSGKSSIFHAILSEMPKVSGDILKSENISGFGYVSQKPWLQCGTIKENILFGKAYDDKKFRMVVDACGLTDDILLLGSNSNVGEGGNALSGGQAARIALARAVYQDKDDDILSAVDVKIGNHIYRKCIMGLLKYKTRILITHSFQYLTQANTIIVMDNGVIKQQGPPDVIITDLDEDLIGVEESDTSTLTNSLKTQIDNISFRDDRSCTSMVDEEISAIGSISFQVIATYWKSVGHWLALAILISLFLMQISRNSTDLWLSYWVGNAVQTNTTNVNISNNDNMHDIKNLLPKEELKRSNSSNGFIDGNNIFVKFSIPAVNKKKDLTSYYLIIYGGFAIVNGLFTLIRAFLFAFGGIQAAITIHNVFLKAIIKSKMKFFDLTPLGRILNRFSSDTYTVDDSLPFILNILMAQIFGVLGSVILTAYGLPWVCLVIVPLIPIYHWLQHRYRITSRELKRLSSVTLSPIYSHFSDTIEGAVIIRAFGRNNQWLQNGEHYIERCQRAILSSVAASQWLSLRLQLMGSAILTGGAIIAAVQRNIDMVDAGLVGLAISYALSVTSLLSGVINAFTETEREMIAVERISEYINQIEPEGNDLDSNCVMPPFAWPSLGIISFNNVVMKYRPHLSASLKDVSFETLPGEKLGVVGRTGAGKSSLFASLFRMSELYNGSIKVDSVDISTLSLSVLRCRIAIIPQEPFIFNGSIRENLDPLKQFTDTELWSALEKSSAKQIIKSKGGLHIAATGLSRGHMQLLCLTRAILQNSKIICIDEATANIDYETDRIIQNTIKCVFRKSTVITIAHRVSTILDSDRVIVMDDGQIIEFDKPDLLLRNENSMFHSLVMQDNWNDDQNDC